MIICIECEVMKPSLLTRRIETVFNRTVKTTSFPFTKLHLTSRAHAKLAICKALLVGPCSFLRRLFCPRDWIKQDNQQCNGKHNLKNQISDTSYFFKLFTIFISCMLQSLLLVHLYCYLTQAHLFKNVTNLFNF